MRLKPLLAARRRSLWGFALLVLVLPLANARSSDPRVGHPRPPSPQIFSPNSKTPCVFPDSNIDVLQSFSHLTGKDFNCVLVFNNDRPTWAWWEALWVASPPHPDMNMVNWVKAVPGRRLIISQPMVPDSVPSDWRALGAEGKYDKYAVAFARYLVSLGLGNSVIRLGWEANGQSDGENALGTTPTQWHNWARYWANIARSMSSVKGASFLFDWTVNEYYQPIPLGDWYPGNSVVDIIGIDAYDSGVDGPQATPEQRWESLLHEPDGLAAVASFAQAHGKPLSIPEWGLVQTGKADGADDDPTYVQGLANFIRDHNVVYESYFYQPGAPEIIPLTQAPQSLKVYINSFSRGQMLPTPSRPPDRSARPGTAPSTTSSH